MGWLWINNMNIFRHFWAVICLMASAGVLQALVMIPLEIEELSKKAELVVQGVVISQASRKDESGRIYTEVELDVAEVWKGNVTTKRLKVVLGGGVVDGRRAVVSGQVDYSKGEEVVGFFRFNDRGEAVTIGLAQGKFQIVTDEQTGEKLASNPFHGETRRSIAKAGISARTNLEPLTLLRLKQLVQGSTR